MHPKSPMAQILTANFQSDLGILALNFAICEDLS